MNDVLPIKFLGYIHFDDEPIVVEEQKSKDDMTFIYVVSNSIYAKNNVYKIGKHTGTKKMLMKRYKTYLIEPIIYLFFPSGDVSNDETTLLKRFSKYRMGTSEFVQIPIDTLLENIKLYYRMKYERHPCVKFAHHVCFYEGKMYDIYDKKIKGKECIIREKLIHVENENYRKQITFQLGEEHIYCLNFEKISDFLGDIERMKEFFNCFLIEYNKRDSVLFLNRFFENGWNGVWIEFMKKIYGYESFKELTRKEVLQKEKFHERLIVVKNTNEPLEWVMDKIQSTQTCFIIEDENIYSIENTEINVEILDLFYYLFYFL